MSATHNTTSAPSAHKFRRWVLRSPPAEWAIAKVCDLLIGALRQGPVPRHVAFVMDGNRRFARNNHIETVEGHNLGFEALARILEVCYKAGVEVVSIYAFSIENFKRPKYEVDALMDMARVKLGQLAQHGDLLDRYGASIRVLGAREMVNKDVLKAVDKAVELTKHNKRAVLNVCFPYTSRDEITSAIRSTVTEYSQPLPSPSSKRPFSESSITRNLRSRHLNSLTTLREESSSRSPTPDPKPITDETSTASTHSTGRDTDSLNRSTAGSPFSSSTTLNHDSNTSPSISAQQSPSLPPSDIPADQAQDAKPTDATYPDPETINAATITSHLYTAGTPPLDLLIRTSGVERLSDFMLWQCHESTSIVFLKCMWPEFDLWQFLPVLIEWQWWRMQRSSGAEDTLKSA